MQISEPAEYIILGLLQTQSMHGYEMYQQFAEGTLSQIVHLEMSQLYAFLKKLERLACIAAQLEPQGSRPPRKVYHLTSTGHDLFLSWLAQPVEKPRDVRILFLIKLYFAQQILPGRVAELVEQQIVACRRFLAHLETQQQTAIEADGDAAFFHHVVLRSRIHQTRSLLDWLAELQHEVA